MVSLKFKSTAEIKIPKQLVGQVIGQDEAVQVVKKAAQQRRHVLLIGEPGTGKCVGKDTTIISENGPIRAESLFNKLQRRSIEVKKEDSTYLIPTDRLFLYTLDKDYKITKKAVKSAYRGVRKKAIKITTSAGSEVVVSGEHPILTISDGKMMFLPSDELKEGRYIASARRLPESQNNLFPSEKLDSKNLRVERGIAQFIGKNGVRSLSLKVPHFISNELSYFLGICAAEARWQGNLVIFNSNERIKKFIVNVLVKEFDYPKEFIIEFDKGVFLKKSRTLVEMLNLCFDFPLETTKQASKKKVPSILFSCSNDILSHFLSGIIDGDGHIGKRGFELTSSSRELIGGINILLLKFGIKARISRSYKYAANTKNKIKRLYYRIAIYETQNILKLYEYLNLLIERKRSAVDFFKNKKPNTNVDVVPSIGKQIYKIKKDLKITFEDLDENHATFFKFSSGKRELSRSLAQSIINKFKSLSSSSNQSQTELILESHSELKNLDLIVNSDIFWDRIKSMSLVEEDLYDFEIDETHNFFVSSGIVVHNSMLGLALAELLPMEKLADIVAFPNPNDENAPLIRTLPAGHGRDLVAKAKLQSMAMFKNQNIIMFIILILAIFGPFWAWNYFSKYGSTAAAIMSASSLLVLILVMIGFSLSLNLGRRVEAKVKIPRVIVDNFRKKQAPFNDATGAHAGALLGDVLHDPFQCFLPTTKFTYVENNTNKNTEIYKEIDSLFAKHKNNVIYKKGYEAVFLDKNELFVIGENNGSVAPVEVLSCNRQDYNGKVIKLTTSANKEIIVTPEHKIAVNKNGKIAYLEARNIKSGDEIASKAEDVIVDEQDIINTYDKRQQEQCKLYYQYLDIKAQNPTWGYKKIAKSMDQNIGKTRWWHSNKHIPVPIQAANWLKERGLLPLKANNPKLPLIAKIFGATFGDGGIFENLNGVFLSSSEKSAVEEFGRDIEDVFELKLNENSRIMEGGEKGHSWCYQNTNRNIIRFFLALGAPQGNKTRLALEIPNWIYLSDTFADEFFGSLFGGELGSPKVHKQKNRLQTLDFAITGTKELEDNRISFLNKIKKYLEDKEVNSTSLIKRTTKNERLLLYRLLISIKFDNVVNFIKNVKINYCRYKKEKLVNAINEFRALKKNKYDELISQGYGAENAMKLLQLTPKSLYTVLNEETIA